MLFCDYGRPRHKFNLFPKLSGKAAIYYLPRLRRLGPQSGTVMTAKESVAPLVEDEFNNGPGRQFAVGHNSRGELEYLKFRGKYFTWRSSDIPPLDTYKEALRQKALQAVDGYVFQASALRLCGFNVFRTGDYHIPTMLRGKRNVAKFQTREFLPRNQEWSGPRDIAHLAFLSLDIWELPIYHFWADPIIFTKKPDEMTEAERIDAEIAKIRAERKAKCGDEGIKLRPMPNITPVDQLWQNKLAQFQDILVNYELNNPDSSLMDLIQKIFLESQIRQLVASGEHSQLTVLQGRNQLLYFDNLDNGAFKGVKNNAATKFCMVYFGLPVEPLTEINIYNAGKCKDDQRDQVELDFSILPIIYGAEADLEFLDKYHERSYGYPTLRCKFYGTS